MSWNHSHTKLRKWFVQEPFRCSTVTNILETIENDWDSKKLLQSPISHTPVVALILDTMGKLIFAPDLGI